MTHPIQISVKISNDEQKYVKKSLVYDEIRISKDDPILKGLVNDAINDFKGNIDECVVTLSFQW